MNLPFSFISDQFKEYKPNTLLHTSLSIDASTLTTTTTYYSFILDTILTPGQHYMFSLDVIGTNVQQSAGRTIVYGTDNEPIVATIAPGETDTYNLDISYFNNLSENASGTWSNTNFAPRGDLGLHTANNGAGIQHKMSVKDSPFTSDKIAIDGTLGSVPVNGTIMNDNRQEIAQSFIWPDMTFVPNWTNNLSKIEIQLSRGSNALSGPMVIKIYDVTEVTPLTNSNSV